MEDDMTSHNQARADCLQALRDMSLMPTPPEGVKCCVDETISVKEMVAELEDTRAGDLSIAQLELLVARQEDGDLMKCNVVSLGDLGRKDIRHEPGDAGTTKSFLDAKSFFDGFGLPYELVSGNHDLEGMDEFTTDEANIKAWMDCFGKPTPQFCRQIGEKTLIVGLSTIRFRDAPFSSHEVHVDDAQLEWFEKIVNAHPAEDGWKILVSSHAPIMVGPRRVHVIRPAFFVAHHELSLLDSSLHLLRVVVFVCCRMFIL
jgi:hypothetical protein